MRDHLDALRTMLIQAAHGRRTITAEKLAAALDTAPEALEALLAVINTDCARRGEPSLAALVAADADDTVGTEDIGHTATAPIACYHHDGPRIVRF